MSVQAAGSIAGGLAVGPLVKRVGEARTLGIALAAWTAASLIYMIPALPAACTALAIFGIAVPLNTVVITTATQRYSPPRLQGRVFAASFMAADLAQTLSITIGAALVDTLGYQPLLIITATVLSIAAIPVLTRPAQPPAMHTQPAATGLHPRAADLTAEYRALPIPTFPVPDSPHGKDSCESRTTPATNPH